MKTQVQKWGNSLALRIPSAFASEVGIDQGATVDLSVENGRLVIQPTRIPLYRLAELVSRIVPENLHPETETGPAVGLEIVG